MSQTAAMSEADESSTPTGLVGDSAKIAAAVAVSRVTGLLRIVVVAAVLGPTVLGDLFVAVNVLPLILYDIIAGSAISSVLVPPIVRLLATEPVERVRSFVGNASGVIVGAMAAVVVLAVLGRQWIADALTAGVDQALAEDAGRVAAVLLVLIVPQLVFYALIGVFVSVQHSRRRFLLPSAAPIVENLVLIATVAAVGVMYGTGREVDEVPPEVLLILGLGSGFAVGVHALVQLVGARRALGSFRLSFDRADPNVRSLAGPAKDSFGWSSVVAGRQFALVVAASFAGAGAVQAFEIATLIYFIPVALVGRPVASAALPRLAVAADDGRRLLTGYLTALRLVAWVAVPAGLALVVLASPLAAGVAYGQFDGDDPIRLVTYGLAGLGIGAASEALFEVARQTMMARPGRRAALRRSTWLRAGVAAIGVPAVVLLLEGPPIVLGLGLVVSIGDVVALVVMHRSLRLDPSWPAAMTAGTSASTGTAHWPRVMLASVVAVASGAGVDALVNARWSETIGNPTRLALVAATATVVYVFAAWLASGRGRLFVGGGAGGTASLRVASRGANPPTAEAGTS